MAIWNPNPPLTGIRLTITPYTTGQSPRTVIQRADDDSASPGNPDSGTWEDIAYSYAQSTFTYVDPLPLSGDRYHYRVLHSQDGWNASSALGTVDAEAITLDEVFV